jgi:methylphosphotriester-DNA--protein-cysteine methyltransferase
VGNNFSLKFHRPSCLFARAMNAHHLELFHFRKQAVAAGMRPCRWCLPPAWKEVRAVLRPAPEVPGPSP